MMTNPVGGFLGATYHHTHYMLKFNKLETFEYTILFYSIVNKRIKITGKDPEEAAFLGMWEKLQTECEPVLIVTKFMKGLADRLGDKEITDHDIKFLVGKAFGSYFIYSEIPDTMERYTLKLRGKDYTIGDIVGACYQLSSKKQIPMVHMFIDKCKVGVDEFFRNFKGIDLSETNALLNWDKVKQEEKKLMIAKRKSTK